MRWTKTWETFAAPQIHLDFFCLSHASSSCGFSSLVCSCLQTFPKWYASCWRHYCMTLSTREWAACVFVRVSGRQCVWKSCMHPSAIYNCVSKLPMGAGGSDRDSAVCVWLTKDICGMSFLSDGLQLVVTPAVLSVAVPRMLHHLRINNNKNRILEEVKPTEMWHRYHKSRSLHNCVAWWRLLDNKVSFSIMISICIDTICIWALHRFIYCSCCCLD